MNTRPWSKWVTLYTDASFYPATRAAAIGVRARYHNEATPIRFEHAAKIQCQDSVAAECEAIIAGLLLARQTWGDLEGAGINTDCLAAIDLLQKGRRLHRREDLKKLQHRFRTASRGLGIRFKHVKAHQTDGSVRTWLNNRVDALARIAQTEEEDGGDGTLFAALETR